MAFFSAYTDGMLEPLRLRVVDALSSETSATLSTNGPGGIQAGFFPCESDGLTLYLLVPASSDVLYNPVSYTHLRAHETVLDLVCRLLLEKKKQH